jgi:hypothetical protein
MQGRRLVQVSAECVCTCPYPLVVPLRALNFMGSCFAMRFTLHRDLLPQWTYHSRRLWRVHERYCNACLPPGVWRCGVGPSHDDAGPNPNIVQTETYTPTKP